MKNELAGGIVLEKGKSQYDESGRLLSPKIMAEEKIDRLEL